MSIQIRTITRNSAAFLALSALPGFSAFATVKPSLPLTINPAAITTQQPQFQQPTVIPTGNWPVSIASADLNNDGHPDLVYTDYGATSTVSTSHILLNNGDGSFKPGQTIATSGAVIAVADFDRDGHPDLEWVSAIQGQGRVYFAHGNGDGTFAPTTQLGTFAQIGSALPQLTYIAAARMHDTGYLDLLVEDTANSTLFELTADSSGTLVRLYGIHFPDGTGPITTADLNSDGHTDLVIQSTTSVDVFLGSADGILSAPTPYSIGTGIHSALLQDMDGDGHPDLVLETTSGTLTILHGFPDGTFATSSEGGTNTLDPATGAGGHLIAVIGPASGQPAAQHIYTATPAGISLLNQSGQSNINLTLQGIYNAGPSPATGHASYLVADFNHDGSPDLALDSPEGIAILFGNPDGTLQTSRSFSTPQPALTATATGTGVAVTTAAQTQLLPSLGDGAFGPATSSALPLPSNPVALPSTLPRLPTNTNLNATSVILADLDNDGHRDYIATFDNPAADHAHPISAAYNQIYLWFGKADGTYSNPTILTPARNYNQVAAVDLEKGGLLDLVLSDGYVVGVVRNLGNRTFGSEQHLLAGTGITSISSADLNQDGTADLIVSNGPQPRTAGASNGGVNNGGVTVLLNKVKPRALISTTTAIILTTPTTISFGQIVDGYAQVVASDSSTLTGTISFFDGIIDICTIPVQNSVNCPASAGTGFTTGTHLVTAVYSGDASHAGSTSTAAIVTVLPDATTATLTTSLNPAFAGQPITFTATLTGTFAAPTGSVTFTENGGTIGTSTLTPGSARNSSVATFTTSSLTAGTHIITAVFVGTQNFTASTSDPISQVITPATTSFATTVTISSSANPVVTGKPINLTATVVSVTPAVPGAPALTGTVTFLDGNVTLGTAAPDPNGLATFSISSLSVGHHLITASYGGSPTASSSVSPPFDQAVNASSLPTAVSFIIAAGSTTLATGGSTNILVRVTPVNGFNQAVQLQCSNLPTQATCNFAAATVPSGGGTTTLKLITLAPRACGSATAYNQASSLPYGNLTYGGPALAGLLVFFLPRRRRAWRGLLTILAMTGLIAVAGCAACTDLGTRPGTYTIHVTGTSMGGTQMTVIQNVQITVTE